MKCEYKNQREKKIVPKTSESSYVFVNLDHVNYNINIIHLMYINDKVKNRQKKRFCKKKKSVEKVIVLRVKTITPLKNSIEF